MSEGRILVINADDHGEAKFAPAIREALMLGIVTSATVLVTRSEAVASIRDGLSMGASIGLHLNLTAGRPASAGASIPSLVTRSGELLGKETFERRLEAGMISPEELRLECAAQLEAFHEIAGSYPGHVDGHHHVQARPTVAEELSHLCAERGIGRIRLPIEAPEDFSHLYPEQRSWAEEMTADARRSKPVYERFGLRWPKFMGLGYGWSDARSSRVLNRLACLDPGVTEYMVHIARPGDLPETDPAHQRVYEWNLLGSRPFRDALDRLEITLGTFADL